MSDSIYLDNNSTSRILPEVVEAMTACLHEGYLNPASQHASGRAARRVLEQCREQIATYLGATLQAPNQDQLVFTSGGTEANNLAIRGLVNVPGDVLVCAIEHPSVLAAADQLELLGVDRKCDVQPIPVNEQGHVDIETFSQLLSDNTRLVCVMLGNNEIGTLQPVQQIAELCRSRNVPLHCDAVQVIGKLPTSFHQLGVTTLAFSAHKFHGPRGVGGLLIRSRTNLNPLLVGGAQQLGIRPGTESIVNVVGMAKALEIFHRDPNSRKRQMRELRDLLERQLLERCDVIVNGCEPRLPHTLNVSFPGIDRQALVMAMDLAGIECSTGSACSSGSSEPSHVLLAMGLERSLVESSIRFSLSCLTTESEINHAVKRISSVVSNLRRGKRVD